MTTADRDGLIERAKDEAADAIALARVGYAAPDARVTLAEWTELLAGRLAWHGVFDRAAAEYDGAASLAELSGSPVAAPWAARLRAQAVEMRARHDAGLGVRG